MCLDRQDLLIWSTLGEAAVPTLRTRMGDLPLTENSCIGLLAWLPTQVKL